MPDFIDVDRFLQRSDFESLDTLKWPWLINHFILGKSCHNCNYRPDISLPRHFKIHASNVQALLGLNFFWCQGCFNYTIYDHYPDDGECQHC